MYISGNTDKVRAAIERGLALEEAFGDRRHQLQLLYGLYRLLMRPSDFRAALAAAQQSATLVEGAQDPAGLVVADFMLGTCHHFMGDQASAQFYGERGMARAAEPGTLIPNFFGFDHRIYAPISLSRSLWLRGFSDQARSIARNAIDGAASRDNPLSICVALAYGSPVFLWSGDFQTADDYVERLIEICETTLDRAVPRRRPRTEGSPCHCPRGSGTRRRLATECARDPICQKAEYICLRFLPERWRRACA
jgi:hypothetical protein